MPTALSTPFASISLHKAHKLLKSETHGIITRGKLHFTLHLRDQHHAQMKFQLLHPSPDDRSVREHQGLEGRSQVPREPLGLGAGGCTNTQQQMLQVSPRELRGMLNTTRILWSNSFALIRTISFCSVTVLHPVMYVLCRGGKKPPNAALRSQAKCLLELLTNMCVCVSMCVWLHSSFLHPHIQHRESANA